MDINNRTNEIAHIVQEYILPAQGADLQEVCELCAPYLDRIAGSSKPEDWIDFAFSYLRAQYFPENFEISCTKAWEEAVDFYLTVLNGIFDREQRELAFDPRRDFDLLRDEERSNCSILPEYERFRSCVHEGFVYAFMRLSRICTPFDTLGHVAGVHHVSMYMARQLVSTDVKIDLGLMSGAAMLHDIGKYGCRPDEGRRVPYLHYYYTYQFCEHYHLPMISSIGSNHSVWDLELDNLSVESLLLIYADFRVKSRRRPDGTEEVIFWTLDQSYDVILQKLDQVDEKKQKRYHKVYRKLKDFEDFMVSLGCSTDLNSGFSGNEPSTSLVLADTAQLTWECKARAIRSNLSVMYHIGHADRFLNILEEIRSEKDWRHIRAFLTTLEEYSEYLSQRQKDMILRFLYEMLAHRDGDIRRQAARIMGKMIAEYEIVYAKEVPHGFAAPQIGRKSSEVWSEYLRKMIITDHSVSGRHKRLIGYAMKMVFQELLLRIKEPVSILEKYVELCASGETDALGRFFLLDGAADIPVSVCSKEQQEVMEKLALRALKEGDLEMRVTALRFLYEWMRQDWMPERNLHSYLFRIYEDIDSEIYCVRYLVARIREYYGIPSQNGLGIYDISPLYLENQRAEVPWICKYVNLAILRIRHNMHDDTDRRYQYASHLLHLLQFADRIVNRLKAGEDLLAVVPLLTPTQRYEIVVELIHALEMGEYAAAKYVPGFLGRIYFCLTLEERRGFLDQFRRLLGSSNSRVVIVALETIGVILEYFPMNRNGQVDREQLQEELECAEGLLCIGIAHFDREVALEALYTAGLHIFGSSHLRLLQKKRYFSDLSRKILTLMNGNTESLYLYFHAAAMHHVYSFLSDYRAVYDSDPMEEEELPSAFFPGTFDPFSSGHKAIVEELHRLGFRVYLAVDEFSWSKNTQPFLIRSKILEMATADLSNVYVFPKESPINIANPDDLKLLIQLFRGKKPHIVVGSDVIENASAYRVTEPGNIKEFPHILFARDLEAIDRNAVEQTIAQEVIYMKLPTFFESISSSRIREYITSSRDISSMVDPIVQNYIYETGLYSMEPTFKKAARVSAIDTFVDQSISDDLKEELHSILQLPFDVSREDGDQIMYLRDRSAESVICGAASFRELDSSGFYRACGSLALAEKLRNQTSGKIAWITNAGGLVTDLDDKRLTVVNELLVYLQEKGFSYVICLDAHAMDIQHALTLHGAVRVEADSSCFLVDLRHPLVVFYNTPDSFKEALAGDASVRSAIRRAHLELLRAVTELYPGNLVLTFDSNIINYRLVKMIAEENSVNPDPASKRKLGEKICVPFGKILKGVLVPNTVTKALDTEKIYDPELKHFQITEFPGYAPLEIQMETIKSFRRPIMLVDDLYHRGFRMEEIERYMSQSGMEEEVLLVGVISGQGRDLAESRKKHVRAAYNVPNMRHWLIESELFPLIGGDGVESVNRQKGTMALPSITQILPYCMPDRMEDVPMERIYHLSEVCLKNAREIYLALERAYALKFERKLTLERLGEAVAEPRIPDTYYGDLQVEPSRVLEQEIKKLKRLQNMTISKYYK